MFKITIKKISPKTFVGTVFRTRESNTEFFLCRCDESDKTYVRHFNDKDNNGRLDTGIDITYYSYINIFNFFKNGDWIKIPEKSIEFIM